MIVKFTHLPFNLLTKYGQHLHFNTKSPEHLAL